MRKRDYANSRDFKDDIRPNFKRLNNKEVNVDIFVTNIIYHTASSTHWNREFEIFYVEKGFIAVTSKNTENVLQQGDIFILNYNEPHVIERLEKSVILCVLQVSAYFFESGGSTILKGFKALETVIRKTDPRNKRIKSVMFALANMKVDVGIINFGANLRELALTLFLFDYLMESVEWINISNKEQRIEENKVERLDKIINYMNKNYTEKIFLSDMSKKLDLTLTYLSHFFSDNFNMPFTRYLNEVRFEKAMELFMTTDLSVIEIASACGFSDVRYLNKMFLENYGVKPEHFYRIEGKDRINDAVDGNLIDEGSYYSDLDINEIIAIVEENYNESKDMLHDLFISNA